MTEIRVALAGDEALDALVEVAEEAARWLWDRGIRQWEPGSVRAARGALAAEIERGALVAARDGDALVGGCILSPTAPAGWRARPARALHVSKLVVARSHAGHGIPLGILRFAESHARAIGHALLRLDCWDGNARLRAYYRDAGFAELESADELGWRVRLFERAL